MRTSTCYLLICLWLFSSPVEAQIVNTDQGKVEFIGLNQWSVPSLVDTLQALAPDTPLHACAHILKRDLNFADASVMKYPNEQGFYTVVTVVEPADSSRVTYLPVPIDKIEQATNWREADTVLTKHYSAFYSGLHSYGLILAGQADSAYAEAERLAKYIDPQPMKTLWHFLEQHNDPADREQAYLTLTRDGNEQNRTIATAILSNFADSDLTWWLLATALRDSSPMVRRTSETVLQSLSMHLPKNVDWKPAVTSLRNSLNGTNLFAFPILLNVLQKTSISSELAAPLLADNADLVLAYLSAEHEGTRNTAENFLAHLSNQNYESPIQWSAWVNQLQSE